MTSIGLSGNAVGAQRRGMTRLRAFAVLAFTAFVGACATPPQSLLDPVQTPVTRTNVSLRTLPPPDRRVTVSVYKFDDLTGQFKDNANVQTLSRAVTQGAAPMLIKALQDAGQRSWFQVLERNALDNLLRERQILTEMRRIYLNDTQLTPGKLPPLLHSSIILEGGVVGYDTNTITGGAGAKYLGVGGDAQYRQDTITVSLRAISTKTGEVLASVTTHKTVSSVALQGGVFRFVALDKILEAEAGITSNEPRQVAVQQAIEKAVHSLVLEGADLGVWRFNDQSAGRAMIAEYRRSQLDSDEALVAGAQDNARTAVSTPRPTELRQLESPRERPSQSRRAVTRRPAQTVPAPERAAPPSTQPPARQGPLGVTPSSSHHAAIWSNVSIAQLSPGTSRY